VALTVQVPRFGTFGVIDSEPVLTMELIVHVPQLVSIIARKLYQLLFQIINNTICNK
jgi:hypothetical protein